MNYEFHKTTEGTNTVIALSEIIDVLGTVAIDKMVGKHVIDISIKKID